MSLAVWDTCHIVHLVLTAVLCLYACKNDFLYLAIIGVLNDFFKGSGNHEDARDVEVESLECLKNSSVIDNQMVR